MRLGAAEPLGVTREHALLKSARCFDASRAEALAAEQELTSDGVFYVRRFAYGVVCPRNAGGRRARHRRRGVTRRQRSGQDPPLPSRRRSRAWPSITGLVPSGRLSLTSTHFAIPMSALA